MKVSDVLKYGAYLLAVVAFMLVVAGLCSLVLLTWRDGQRMRDDMNTANAELTASSERLHQLNAQLAMENDENRRQITVLENNLSALQRQQDLTVDLAVQLYQRQQAQGNMTAIVQPNITVIIQQGRKASGTPMYPIPSRDMQVNNLSEENDVWQENCYTARAGNVVCFRAVNQTTVNPSTEIPSNGGEICENYTDGRLICYHFKSIPK